MNCQPGQIGDNGHVIEMPPISSSRIANMTERNHTRVNSAKPATVTGRGAVSPISMSGQNETAAPKSFASERDPLIKTALSILADQYPGEYINPEAYAKRSAEERQRKSVEEGKISRPLNSYMLYRKAYQQVARRVLSNDQQQFASQIVGISWNQYESPSIKAEFKALARIDHQMHHKAFPSYKYTPTQGRNSRNGVHDSKKLSSSMERRLCRRSGNKETGLHGSTGKKLIRSNNTEAPDQHQPGENNININWWPQELPSFAASLMHHGGHQERYEQCLIPESGYFESQYPEVIDENAFNHLQRQPGHLAASPAECLSLESCIDPSLFSRFEGISMPQPSARYLEWQSQEEQLGHDFHSITPDMSMGQTKDSCYAGQEEWSAQQVDEHRNTFSWHTVGENRSR